MPWWKYQKQPQYKTDRGIAAIYAVISISWFALWCMPSPNEPFFLFLAIVWAVLSIWHLVRSFRSQTRIDSD